jgi:hypothetical protein
MACAAQAVGFLPVIANNPLILGAAAAGYLVSNAAFDYTNDMRIFDLRKSLRDSNARSAGAACSSPA